MTCLHHCSAKQLSYSVAAKKGVKGFSLITACLVLHGSLASATSADEVVVVINDASPTSIAIGTDYAAKRHVGYKLYVRCQDSALKQQNETISSENYALEIETPVKAFLRAHPSVSFIVTTKGVPIRVSGGAFGWAGPNGIRNASLDGQLAALGYDEIPGAIKVEFRIKGNSVSGWAWENRYWNASVPFTHAQFGGYLVTRLDGYTLSDALSLTSRALAAEKRSPKGIVLLDVDATHGGGEKSTEPRPLPGNTITAESSWDTWNADMVHAHDDLVRRHIANLLDLTDGFIGDKKDLTGYFSWGSNDAHFSSAAYESLHFVPGAIGDTAVSTSARSFFHQADGQSLIADLIAHGITGVKGYTDEPLLQAITSPTIALDRYMTGFTLAESLYAASHFVGWTDIVIGDPLARPYPGEGIPPNATFRAARAPYSLLTRAVLKH